MEGEFGIGFGILMLLAIAVGFLSLGLWIWSLIHCAQNRYMNDTNRLIGILLIVFLGLLGSLVYLFLPNEDEPQR